MIFYYYYDYFLGAYFNFEVKQLKQKKSFIWEELMKDKNVCCQWKEMIGNIHFSLSDLETKN
jgi:penicillin-binding protein-related factor A (putative recombinase)